MKKAPRKPLKNAPRKPQISAADNWGEVVFDCLDKAEKWARECGEEITSNAPIRNALNDYLLIRARCSLTGNYDIWNHVNEYLHYVASVGYRKEGAPMAASAKEQAWLEDLRRTALH